jgi:hypothetical protein
MTLPAWAAGTLDIIGKFFANEAEFDIALYTEDHQLVAVIGIATTQRSSVAFAPNEWHSFAELWQKARRMQTATWQLVGTFKETDTTELALLTVMAGPGVQFNITGEKGNFSFVLPKSDFTNFDAKVRQMTTSLAR